MEGCQGSSTGADLVDPASQFADTAVDIRDGLRVIIHLRLYTLQLAIVHSVRSFCACCHMGDLLAGRIDAIRRHGRAIFDADGICGCNRCGIDCLDADIIFEFHRNGFAIDLRSDVRLVAIDSERFRRFHFSRRAFVSSKLRGICICGHDKLLTIAGGIRIPLVCTAGITGSTSLAIHFCRIRSRCTACDIGTDGIGPIFSFNLDAITGNEADL